MKKLSVFAVTLALAAMFCSCGEVKTPTMEEIKGTVDGNVYENSFLEMKFTKPDSWTFATEEEIESIVGTAQEVLNEGGVEEQIDSSRYDMVASDSATGNNINLSLEIAGGTVTDEELRETLDSTKSQLAEMGSQIGMNYTFGDISTVRLGGLEYQKLSANADYLGVTFEQGCYVAVKDGVVVNITFTVYDGTPIADVEALFTE